MAESAVWWFDARSGTVLWVRSSRSLRRFESLFSLKVVEAGGKSANSAGIKSVGWVNHCVYFHCISPFNTNIITTAPQNCLEILHNDDARRRATKYGELAAYRASLQLLMSSRTARS
jgi:hypothetical protein